ncbi:MAG: transcription factor FapR [Halanaerobium sp.]|nr:transcription factor FapR [Halanaerobium sp.]
MKLSKEKRQRKLQEEVKSNPFLTDQELAYYFGVSVQTIRLDRMELGIPEMRKRTQNLAQIAYARVKSVESTEIIGQLVDLRLNEFGLSRLICSETMGFERTGIVRGFYIFAQANSLAVAVIDGKTVLTGIAKLKFKKPVYTGQELLARAQVRRKKGKNFVVRVKTMVKEEEVFRGDFLVSIIEGEDGDE